MKTLKTVIVICTAALFVRPMSTNAQWSNVGSGTDLSVYAITSDTLNDLVYAGGIFNQAGGNVSIHIASWDGLSWSPVGSGVSIGASVYALVVRNGELYSGGEFSNIGGVGVNNVGMWDGSSWNDLGGGMVDTSSNSTIIRALTFHNNELYAGGFFTHAGSSTANNIAKWNGSSWSPLSTGTNGPVWALYSWNGKLYVGGNFDQAGGLSVSNLASWDGTSWSDVGAGVSNSSNNKVSALGEYQGDLIVGGTFDTAGGTLTANNLVKWDGSGWFNIGAGGFDYNGVTNIGTVIPFDNELIAGGQYTLVDGSPANFIASWDGANWSPMNFGMDSTVHASCALNDTLYVGGDFTMADSSQAAHVAKWGKQQVGVQSRAKNGMSLYPNPTNGSIFIDVAGNRVSFEITSITGKQIKSGQLKSGLNSIQLSGYPKGIYIVNLFSGDEIIQVSKLIID